MIFVFYLFAAVLIYFSFQSLRGGVAYLDYFRRALAEPKSDYQPFTTVFAPCRGLDDDLEKNLAALLRQDFPAYEIIFVVDSRTDKAVSVIERVIHHRDAEEGRREINRDEGDERNIKEEEDKKDEENKENEKSGIYKENSASLCLCGENSIPAKLVLAGKASNESQKVHNLREAVTHAAQESKVFVFVDSDARPGRDWLRSLIAPLRDETIGAATGYRWFISPKRNFASELRAVWNASIASALGANRAKNFVWGGATAMRRETFEKLGMTERWRGTTSDDFAVTRAMKAANLPIVFVPQALTASVENCNLRELFEFTTRQMKITRVYAQHLWIASFLGAGLFNLVFIWAIFNLFFYPAKSFALWFSLVSLLSVSAFSMGKSHLRLKAVRLVLTDYERDLKKQLRTQNTLWILSPAVYFYNCVCALLSRRIVWRGISYELKSADETIVGAENTTRK